MRRVTRITIEMVDSEGKKSTKEYEARIPASLYFSHRDAAMAGPAIGGSWRQSLLTRLPASPNADPLTYPSPKIVASATPTEEEDGFVGHDESCDWF